MRPDTDGSDPGPGPDLTLSSSSPSGSRELIPALVRPGHLLWRAHARVMLAVPQALPPGVDLNAYAVLVTLGEDAAGRARSQQDLADLLSTSRTTLARVAADLTAAGLLARVRSPADRRSYALTCTAEGARAAADWTEHVAALEDRLTAGFATAERADLADLLTRLLAATDSDDQVVVPRALRGSLAFLISRVHGRVHRDFLEALEPLDLQPRLYGALTALRATGPVSQAELARFLGTSGASVVAKVDDLERRGLVERRRDPADRRLHLLHLTAAAPAIHQQAAALEETTLGHHLATLGSRGTDRMVSLLRRFVTDAGT